MHIKIRNLIKMESNNLQIHSSVLPKYSDVQLEIVRPLLYVLVLCKNSNIFRQSHFYNDKFEQEDL